jgi:hypothetical protein
VQWFNSKLPRGIQTLDELKNFLLIIRNSEKVTNLTLCGVLFRKLIVAHINKISSRLEWNHGHKTSPLVPNRIFFTLFLLLCTGTKSHRIHVILCFSVSLFSCIRATVSRLSHRGTTHREIHVTKQEKQWVLRQIWELLRVLN